MKKISKTQSLIKTNKRYYRVCLLLPMWSCNASISITWELSSKAVSGPTPPTESEPEFCKIFQVICVLIHVGDGLV